MSHELRTPLNAVIGFSQLIESQMFGKIDNPQYMEYVHHIQQSGYDLLSRIEDLLEIANIEAGRVTLSRAAVNPSDILRHVVETQAHHALAAHVTLESVPPEGDLTFYIDRLKMQHILSHLVANAIRFSHKGGHVTLSASCSSDNDLQFCVHDTGEGMTDEQVGAIASALSEENCWASGDNRSVGLGLALAREFAAMHGGQVSVRSRQGKGTTVQITLPPDCIHRAPDHARQAVS
jgi:two-component system cell cycle sensor histidine kinase PleC